MLSWTSSQPRNCFFFLLRLLTSAVDAASLLLLIWASPRLTRQLASWARFNNNVCVLFIPVSIHPRGHLNWIADKLSIRTLFKRIANTSAAYFSPSHNSSLASSSCSFTRCSISISNYPQWKISISIKFFLSALHQSIKTNRMKEKSGKKAKKKRKANNSPIMMERAARNYTFICLRCFWHRMKTDGWWRRSWRFLVRNGSLVMSHWNWI